MKKINAIKTHLLGAFLFFAVAIGYHANSAQAAQPPAPTKPSALHTISINANVWISIAPTYEPYKGKVAPGVTDTLKNIAESNDVNLRAIVLKTFRTRLEQKDIPVTLAATSADAELQIHIENYGLTARNKLLMQPTITIQARLIKSNGHVIWDAGENLSDSDLSGVSAQKWQDYTVNPALLKTSFEEITNAAVNTIVDNFIEAHKAGEIGE